MKHLLYFLPQALALYLHITSFPAFTTASFQSPDVDEKINIMSALNTKSAKRNPESAELCLADSDESPSPSEENAATRSRQPTSKAFKDFIASGWGKPTPGVTPEAEVAPHAADRRFKLSQKFCEDYVIIPAGPLKQRSNDTDYRFRPHSAFAYYTGLGADYLSDAVLVLEPVPAGSGDSNQSGERCSHKATLYFRPLAGRDDEEFYKDTRYGEFWVGPRPTLTQLCRQFLIETASLDEFPGLLKRIGSNVRVIREADPAITAAVENLRRSAAEKVNTVRYDDDLEEFAAEARLIKDGWEVVQLERAIAATAEGFAEVIRQIPRALKHPRGERVVEGAFSTRAREEGNGLGYDVIAASGNNATILHWIRNDGQTKDGDLLLLDAGVEGNWLYTADITRTVPLNGSYSSTQRRIYQAVLEAADAAFAAATPGRLFREVHDAAMEVLVSYLEDWGLLPVTSAVSLSPEGQQHRRWMPHGTSHHLGIDVHDCAKARSELYIDGKIQPGMVFTIEPGLYFKNDDLSVPEEYRGIGVRIEDDILIRDNGPVNLSEALPREIHEVEAWMKEIWLKAA